MAGGKRSQHADLAAVALAGGATQERAADAAGVTVRTLAEWCTRADFKARVDHFRRQMIGRACGVLARNMSKAARVLVKLLDDPNSRVRLKAASELIGCGLKVNELAALAEQVEELTAAVEELRSRRGRDR